MVTEAHAEQREGFFYALAMDLWPGQRKSHPIAWDRNVRLLYEFSLQHPHAGPNDPLGLRAHGGYKNPHAALVASERYLRAPKQHELFGDLQSGRTNAAADLLGIDYASGPTLPVRLKGGYLTGGKGPSTWDYIKGTVKDLPKGTARAGKDIGGGAVDAGKGIAGIGGWLGKNIVIVLVLVVVIVLVTKK